LRLQSLRVGLIISAVVALLRERLGTLSWDIVPVLVLILGCMVSLAFAVVGAAALESGDGHGRRCSQ
jgi:predicted outer membrane lipoprotein